MSFFNIPPGSFSVLASILGVGLAKNLNSDQQNSLGNFILSVGQSIVTFNAQQTLQQSKDDNQQMIDQIQLMKQQLEFFEGRLKTKL